MKKRTKKTPKFTFFVKNLMQKTTFLKKNFGKTTFFFKTIKNDGYFMICMYLYLKNLHQRFFFRKTWCSLIKGSMTFALFSWYKIAARVRCEIITAIALHHPVPQ